MFCLEFPGVKRNTKKALAFFSNFFQKSMSSTPFIIFFGIAYSEKLDLNWYCKELAQKEALPLCQDRAFAPFSCVLSLSLVLGRLTHLHCDTSSLGRGVPLHGKESNPSSPTFPICIFAVNTLSKAGENPQPYSIL